MTSKEITVRDIDGTIPGRAALVLIDLNDPDGRSGFMHSLFIEGEGTCTNPVLHARALYESIEDDWSNHTMAIVTSPRANYLDILHRMRELDMSGDYTPADYLGA